MQTDYEYAAMIYHLRLNEYKTAQEVEDAAWAALEKIQQGHDHLRVAVSAVVDSLIRDDDWMDAWAWCEKVRDESWSMRTAAAAVWREALDRKHNAATAVESAKQYALSADTEERPLMR